MSFNEAWNATDTDLEVVYNTLAMMCENMENERLSFAIMGVMDRIEIAQNHLNAVFESWKEENNGGQV